MKILIVGNRGSTHIGGAFEWAAAELGLEVDLIEAWRAAEAPIWLRRFNWWLRGKRPTHLEKFGCEVAARCRSWRPEMLLATGIAPLSGDVLREFGHLGIRRLNYLTDDPWNPAHRAPWFLKALPMYDVIFSPRKSNMEDLRQAGCRRVLYMLFGYDPSQQFPEPPVSEEEEAKFAADLVFIGSADSDRVPYIRAALEAGISVGLYGSFWDRFPLTRGLSWGQIDPAVMRKAVFGAKVNLCLVRRANRDGHSMRSFEIPAMGGCMLTEDTPEHREIFGDEGKAVVYFRTISEMVEKLRWLLAHDQERRQLARAAHGLIIQGRHSYQDRLKAMLGFTGETP